MPAALSGGADSETNEFPHAIFEHTLIPAQTLLPRLGLLSRDQTGCIQLAKLPSLRWTSPCHDKRQVPRNARDFTCGLQRPQNGSTWETGVRVPAHAKWEPYQRAV